MDPSENKVNDSSEGCNARFLQIWFEIGRGDAGESLTEVGVAFECAVLVQSRGRARQVPAVTCRVARSGALCRSER